MPITIGHALTAHALTALAFAVPVGTGLGATIIRVYGERVIPKQISVFAARLRGRR
jgi:hypothetical protein